MATNKARQTQDEPSDEEVSEAASIMGQKGGQVSGGNFKNRDPEEVREIASKGGSASGGNFKNRDPEEVREIARKGGQHSHQGSSGSQDDEEETEDR